MLISYCFYALFIIVPLILTPYNSELFEFNKMLAVYALTVIIAALWLIRMIVNRKLIFAKTPLDIPIFLFVLSQILSTIFSINQHTSVWGYYSRFHGGLLSTICYVTLFYAFVSNAVSAKKCLTVILSTGTLVALYGIAERLGIDKHIWIQDVQSRVFSTLGQPNWLAAYLIALAPLSYKLVPLFLLVIFFTKSQSGLGAALVVGILAVILYLIKNKILKIICIVLLVAAGIFYAYRLNLLTPFPQVIQLIKAENQTRAGGSSSMLIRRVVWQGALDIWKHYPLFGSGVETFAYSYYNFRPAAHNLLSEWDFLYNKAHNEYLNFLATTGAFGLGSYLILCAAILIQLIKHSRPLALGFISILITNFFGFSVVPIALFFFMFPAFSLESPPEKNKHSPKNIFQIICISAILLFTFYILNFIVNLWRADYYYNLGRQNNFNYLNKAVSLNPSESIYQNEMADQLAMLGASQSAVLLSDAVTHANPVSLNFRRTRVKILLLLSRLDQRYLNEAIDALLYSIKLAPTDAKLYYNLGVIYKQLNQIDLARQAFTKALELKPDYDLKIP
jgi:O-antigen ligase